MTNQLMTNFELKFLCHVMSRPTYAKKLFDRVWGNTHRNGRCFRIIRWNQYAWQWRHDTQQWVRALH